MGSKKDYEDILLGVAEALNGPAEEYAPRGLPGPQTRLQMPDQIDVAAIRRKAHLSQTAFAIRIGVPVATLRNWEQGHRSPTGPARVLLALLDRNPRIVEETLRG
jgi:putative transcriptional regulator